MSVEKGATSRTLLVIGGSSGIARALTRKAFHLGWNIILTERLSRNQPSDIKPDLIEIHKQSTSGEVASENIKSMNLDLESESSVKTLVTTLMRDETKLDGIVFAGAIAHGGRIGMVSDEQLEKVLRINLMSCISLSQRLIRIMNSPASVVFISSDSAQTAITGNFLYGVSKAALERFAKSLALEVASRGIRVNCVSPTLVETAMLDDMDQKSRTEVLSRAYAERVLSPDEVAASVLFLLSEESSAINGQTLYLGQHAR